MTIDLHAFVHALSLALASAAASSMATPAAAPQTFWNSIGGLPTIVGLIGGAVLSAFLSVPITQWLDRKRSRKNAEEAEKRAIAAADAEAKRRAEMKRDPHWIAAATLLHESLFNGLPEEFRIRLTDAILERLEASTHLTEDLVRAVRLFIERRLLQAAKSGSSPIPLEGAALDAAFARVAPQIELLLNHLGQTPETVEFATCFQLDAVQADAAKYLSALTKLEQDYGGSGEPAAIDKSDRFLTPIAVKDGFIAPTVLVSGLLQQFETDWPQALSHFNLALGGNRTKPTLLQRFELYCWLLWGPSIPACECMGWDGSFLVLQYGYGDETNSFPLILDDQVLQDAGKLLRAKFAELLGDPLGPSPNPLPLAFGSRFAGTLVWGPRYRRDDNDYPPVYTVVSNDDTRPRVASGDATIFQGLMLRADSITWLNEQRRYYSAYLWVMFEVCEENPKQLTNGSERWRRLFPIFEHANIADGDTLLFLKQRLAEKACSTVEQIECEAAGKVRLRYLCATDDPGNIQDDHGKHRPRFRADPREDTQLRNEVFAGGGQPDLEALPPLEEHRLRTIMYRRLSDDARRRMFAPPEGEELMTACDLPEIIEDFYRNFLHAPART